MKKEIFKYLSAILIISLILFNCEYRDVQRVQADVGGDITVELVYNHTVLDGLYTIYISVEAKFDSLSQPIEIESVRLDSTFLLKYEDSYVLINPFSRYPEFKYGEPFKWFVKGGNYFDSLFVEINAPVNPPTIIMPDTNFIDLDENLVIRWEKPQGNYDNHLELFFDGPRFDGFGFYLRDTDGEVLIGDEILQNIEGQFFTLSLTRYNTEYLTNDIFSQYSRVRIGVTFSYNIYTK